MVRRLLHLGEAPLGDPGVRNVVYLARCRIENAQLIARQVKAANQCAPPGMPLHSTLAPADQSACAPAGRVAWHLFLTLAGTLREEHCSQHATQTVGGSRIDRGRVVMRIQRAHCAHT